MTGERERCLQLEPACHVPKTASRGRQRFKTGFVTRRFAHGRKENTSLNHLEYIISLKPSKCKQAAFELGKNTSLLSKYTINTLINRCRASLHKLNEEEINSEPHLT